MNNHIDFEKRSIRILLSPMFELFRHKKTNTENDEWLKFVLRTEERIVNNPEQFLGSELPSKLVLEQSVKELFDQYLKEEHQDTVS